MSGATDNHNVASANNTTQNTNRWNISSDSVWGTPDATSDDGEDNEASGGSSSSAVVKPAPNFQDAGLMVKIVIGNGAAKKEYLVYRNFATHYSPVFDRAFNGKFIEAETQVYKIVDFDFPYAFGFVLHWLYTKRFSDGWDDGVSVEDLCRIWVLGDLLLMPDMQDGATRSLCYRPFGKQLKDNPLSVASWIYEKTGPGSPLRRLFAYKCAYELNWEEGIKSGAFDLPADLISEIASVYQVDALKWKRIHRDIHTSNGWGGAEVNHCNGCENTIDVGDYLIRPRPRPRLPGGEGW